MLLLERAPWPGYWQSVTGSLAYASEPLAATAMREVREETGIDASRHTLADWGIENRYEIYREWRWQYAPGITHNVERVFGLTLPGEGRDRARAGRARALSLAALAPGGREVLLVVESRRDPDAARASG